MGAEDPFAAVEAAHDAFAQSLAMRWRLARHEAAADGGDMAFYPAREAEELRRLIRGQGAGAPAEVLVRMWRALCGELLAIRGLKAVHVGGGDLAPLIEAARGYFGFAPQVLAAPTVRDALERASEGHAIACLPWPETAGAGQWWPMLNEARYRDLSILAGWPCRALEQGGLPRMAILARGLARSSGEDDMLATVHDDAHKSERVLEQAGVSARVAARVRSLALLRIEGYVGADDPRLESARRLGLDGLRIVGVLPRI